MYFLYKTSHYIYTEWFAFFVFCCQILGDLFLSCRITSMALVQWQDWHNSNEATIENIGNTA